MSVKKAIIPVAGKGTRFLPATKEIAKEMIPILNVPMIDHVVNEAVSAGIEQIIFVTAAGKEDVENYFDRNMGLEAFLESNNKSDLSSVIKKIGTKVSVTTVRQKEQLGLGHAILMAKDLILPGERFAVLLGDDLTVCSNPVTKQLVDISNEYKKSAVIGVMEVPTEETAKYGIVAGEFLTDNTLKMKTMVEKPKPEDAPTNLATPGRYILNSEIFSCLEKIERGAGGEYQLTDAINMLCETKEVYAHKFEGKRYDTGNLKGYFEAVVDFALEREDLREHVINVMKKSLENLS